MAKSDIKEIVLSEFQHRIRDYKAASYPFLLVDTHEEDRALVDIIGVVDSLNARTNVADIDKVALYVWNCASGLEARMPGGASIKEHTMTDIVDALGKLSECGFGAPKSNQKMIVVFEDAHTFINSASPTVVRLLRNLSRNLKINQQMLIFISPRFDLPVELETEVRRVEYSLPSKEMVARKFTDLAVGAGFDTTNTEYVESIVEAASGLTCNEVENAVASAITAVNRKHGKVVYGPELVRHVFEEKITSLKNSFLEYVPNQSGFESVGGLEPVKTWAMERFVGFSESARNLHLPCPRGALIAGIRGCGKTMVAQAIAGRWGFPFYKLDMGKMFGSLVGQTEANTRSLIRTMESLGRAVVLLDEMDKYFNRSAVSGAGDSGASSRLFGSFLSWLSSKTCPVFVIGTMNNIDELPPELTRKGRFDELFFVDLPTRMERMEIFNSLLTFKFRSSLRIDGNEELIELTKGFSGAEIEALLEASLYRVLSDHLVPTTGISEGVLKKVIYATARNTVPQSRNDGGYVNRMREKMKVGFRRANDPETEGDSAEKVVRRLDVN